MHSPKRVKPSDKYQPYITYTPRGQILLATSSEEKKKVKEAQSKRVAEAVSKLTKIVTEKVMIKMKEMMTDPDS